MQVYSITQYKYIGLDLGNLQCSQVPSSTQKSAMSYADAGRCIACDPDPLQAKPKAFCVCVMDDIR